MADARVRTIVLAIGLAVLAGCQHVATGQGATGLGAQSGARQASLPELRANTSAEVARAQRALADGRLGAARDGFSAALRSGPRDVQAGLGLGETYLALNDHATALQVFEATARHATGRDRGRVSQGLGLIALQGEDLAAARRHLRAAVNADETLWRAWVGLGRLHARSGERDSARVAFARAEAAAPNLGRVMNDIGMSYLLERQPQQAAPFLERALVADPRLAMARGNLRIARAMIGEYDLAIAGAPVEELPDALNNVGYIAVVNGDFDVADSLLRRALEISPTYHEAAAANLNLLAHAQTSGERPTAQARLASAVPVRVASEIKPTGSAPEAAPSGPDLVAMAATQNGTPPETTGNIGFRWDGDGPAARQVAARPESTREAVRSQPGAVSPTRASAQVDHMPVSDSRDLEAYSWAEVPAPVQSGKPGPAAAKAEPSAEEATFRWENTGTSEPMVTQQAMAVATEINMRDDGFLWERTAPSPEQSK